MTNHPLDPLNSDEILRNRAVLQQAGLLHESTRFPLVQLDEPGKAAVLAHRDGEAFDRRVRSVLCDTKTGELTTTLVSLPDGQLVDKSVINPAEHGQPPVMLDEYELVERIVRADETWLRAIRDRGIEDVTKVRVCPLSAGWFGIADESGRRMLRALAFLQNHPEELPWAHPVDGLVAYVDVIERRVLKVVDDRHLPIPAESGDYTDQALFGPQRETLKPIEITQPQGPSFTVDGGHEVRWENWRLRVGFDPREGLVLHQLSFRDGERDRPVIYRASVAEMLVNYGDPSPVRFWQNYFDSGEYSLGKLANELVLGCDCLGEIHYFDEVVAQEDGTPRTLRNAVCMHEEDFGVLWKHTDVFTGSAETRRQRRLVISFFASIGNYDYGFYWYLYLDGTIQLEVKATGIVFTSAYQEGTRWASELAPGLGAPYHQHLFSARLDMMVDGTSNAVDEVQAQRVPVGEENPHGNAFTRSATRLARESDAAREADPASGRTWHIVNTERTNRLGQPVGYALHPQGYPVLLSDPGSSIAKRAAFATKHLWVTQYAADERYPAGEFVNQSHGGAGVPAFTARDRSIDGEDIVLWHTFGLTHFPRAEDWPVMPVDHCGFTLKPVGFFNRNPTLDVPPTHTCGPA
ncbi:primary-amine oxidase [Saccharopolyspora sp. K220]|uniref:primary-amine oxidase n=1 Tax=Saccharopolyspora soli TaxID=2926618 RepID=UPI001F563F63|nr:primary-amine oxidase [Saccharopolyspora soli]MCI2418726.1 primary-amine oxidase [Saccharopolyspora soli]